MIFILMQFPRLPRKTKFNGSTDIGREVKYINEADQHMRVYKRMACSFLERATSLKTVPWRYGPGSASSPLSAHSTVYFNVCIFTSINSRKTPPLNVHWDLRTGPPVRNLKATLVQKLIKRYT